MIRSNNGYLTGDAFFLAYLRALNRKQLLALADWQEERLSDPSKDIVTDVMAKKRMIDQEMRRRDE